MRSPFTPARVIMQDFTGVPAVVDLAAMREAMSGSAAIRIRSIRWRPPSWSIDHSVQVDRYGTARCAGRQQPHRIRAQRRALRVSALGPDGVRQLQGRAAQHRHRAPGQSRVPRPRGVRAARTARSRQAYPDTLVGTDSHTTMINGLGVLGWGVGGIEAEAAMLGQPVTMLIPQVIGFKLSGSLQPGATATDLVLTVTEMLRKQRRGRQVRRVLRRRARQPAARRPRDASATCRPSSAAPAPSSRSTRRRCAT